MTISAVVKPGISIAVIAGCYSLKELGHEDFADFGLNCSEISGRQLNP